MDGGGVDDENRRLGYLCDWHKRWTHEGVRVNAAVGRPGRAVEGGRMGRSGRMGVTLSEAPETETHL